MKKVLDIFIYTKRKYKKILWKTYKKMGLRISLINFYFVMIDIFHKVIVLVRNHLNYFKDNIFDFFFFIDWNRLLFFKIIVFSFS